MQRKIKKTIPLITTSNYTWGQTCLGGERPLLLLFFQTIRIFICFFFRSYLSDKVMGFTVTFPYKHATCIDYIDPCHYPFPPTFVILLFFKNFSSIFITFFYFSTSWVWADHPLIQPNNNKNKLKNKVEDAKGSQDNGLVEWI